MYKLLTTAAVIMAVATPSIANNWTGGQQLVQDLETIYNSLDGESQFGQLQSDSTIANTKHGQLDGFFSEVDKGVTYITLTVDANNNISTGINEGSTFAEISAKKDDLVNRVNYDLFVSTDGEGYTPNAEFDNYVGIKAQKPFDLVGTPEDSGNNDYVESHNQGLAGVKIKGLVDNVNLTNDYLIASDRTKTESGLLIADFNKVGGGTGKYTFTDGDGVEQTADLGKINSDISDLNTAINTASNTTDSEGNITPNGNGFFGDIDGGTFTEANVNQFVIPSYNNFADIGFTGNPGGYKSISDWANGVQTVTVTDGVGTVAATGTVVIVDADAGTITVNGNPFTYNSGTGVFDAG